MKNQAVRYIFVILIWAAALLLWIIKGWWFIAAALFLLHFFETMFTGIRTGKEHGLSRGYSIIMSMAFGIVWWKPLNDEYKEKNIPEDCEE